MFFGRSEEASIPLSPLEAPLRARSSSPCQCGPLARMECGCTGVRDNQGSLSHTAVYNITLTQKAVEGELCTRVWRPDMGGLCLPPEGTVRVLVAGAIID